MKRDEEIKTVAGMAAWSFYQKWMKINRRQPPKLPAFVHSKFYNSFIKFATYSRKVSIPDPDAYIWLMKERDIPPVLWATDEAYAEYLEFTDRRGDPKKQADITIKTMFKFADAFGCEVSELFNNFKPSEVIQLMRERRLSPWILLNSSKFMHFFANTVGSEDRIIIETIIRPKYWAEKFTKHPQDVKLMKLYVGELNL